MEGVPVYGLTAKSKAREEKEKHTFSPVNELIEAHNEMEFRIKRFQVQIEKKAGFMKMN